MTGPKTRPVGEKPSGPKGMKMTKENSTHNGSNSPPLSKFGKAALIYAKAGFAVFPCEPKGKGPLGRLVPKGHNQASTDLDQIRTWWTDCPEANIGLVPGEGRVVLDIDPRSGGEETLKALANGHMKEILATLTAETGGGGFHYFFSGAPENLPGKLGPGVDLKRHRRGYVIVSPSVHPSGQRYRWAKGFKPPLIRSWPDLIPPAKPPKGGNGSDHPPLTPSQIRALLKRINSDDYDLWIAVGQALKQDLGEEGLAYWLPWSAESEKFPGEAECRRKWGTFQGEGRGMGSLVYLAGGQIPPPSAQEDFPDDLGLYLRKKKKKGKTKIVMFAYRDRTPKRVQWLMPGYLVKGVLHCVAGYGGEGKSSVLSAMIAGVTRGVDWINGEPLPDGPSDVMIITEEPVDYQTLPRLALAGADMERVFGIEGVQREDDEVAPWSLADHLEETRSLLAKHPKIRFLVIDPIGSYMASRKREINTWKDSDVREVLTPWQRLAEETGVVVLYIAHNAKGKSDRAMNKVMGSAAFTTVTRLTYTVIKPTESGLAEFGLGGWEEGEDGPEKPEDDLSGFRVLLPTKTNIGPEAKPVVVRMQHIEGEDNPQVKVVAQLPRGSAENLIEQLTSPKSDKREEQDHPLQDRILELVKEQPGLSKTAISEELGVSARSMGVDNAFASLETRGLIMVVRVDGKTKIFAPGQDEVSFLE